MKKLTLIFVFTVLTLIGGSAYASPDQTTVYEWNVNNSGSQVGERIVAYINSGTIGTYTGASIVGQIIDGNGNWGDNLPTVANFKLVTNFSNSSYKLQQDVVTNSVVLELKLISSTQIALVANCPVSNSQLRILYRLTTSNGPTVTLGDPTTVNSTGSMLVSQPTYTNTLTGTLSLNVTNSTSTAGYTLAVGGKAIAESVTVKLQNTWPDYVFKPAYQLPSLASIKTYIDQNQHLPDVPSALEVEKDGLDLGEMNRLLMRKVEELTLYLIEKDEKEKKQQKQIDLLIKQVAELSKEKNGTK